MSTYKINQNQNCIDLVGNLYGDQDNIGTIYTNNIDYDLNLIQKGLNIEYTKPINNQIVNDIVNNNYTFTSGDIAIFKSILLIKHLKGKLVTSFNIGLYGNIYPDYIIKNLDSGEKDINSYGVVTTELSTLSNNINNIEVGVDQTVFEDLIVNNLGFDSSNILSISFIEPIRVAGLFNLDLSNLVYITDFNSILSNISSIVNIGISDQIVTISLENTIQSTERMNNFISSLLQSPLSNVIDSGIINISDNDKEPSGDDWDILVIKGWSFVNTSPH